MRNLTEENLTDVVLDSLNATDPRAKEVISSLIKHLHAW